jgi:hypothetical protein
LTQSAAVGLDTHASESSELDLVASVYRDDQDRRGRSRTPIRGLKTLGGLLVLARCVQGQPDEPTEDTSSLWPLLLVVVFAFIGLVAMVFVLVQQGLLRWKRCRARPSLQPDDSPPTGGKQQPKQYKEVVGTTVFGSSSSRSSSSSRGDSQLVLRRGRDAQAVWAREVEQKWKALNSYCVTCGVQIVEPHAASCCVCRRRMHCLPSCGRTCRCECTLCLKCLSEHLCPFVA